MHNFRKKIIPCVIVFATIALVWLLDLLLYPCTFIRTDLHTVQTKEIEDVYMGTSHGRMNIDPDAVQEITSREGHNLCVGGEYCVDSYYMTKLLIEKNKPKRIIYEVSPGYFMSEKEEGNNYLLFYHEFPFSKAKIEYFCDCVLKCDFRTVWFPWYEYDLAYEIKKLPETVHQKVTGNYDASYLKGAAQIYHENGFIERECVDTDTITMSPLVVFDAENVKENNILYLQKFIQLCREQEIEFVAITTPLPAETLVEYSDSLNEAWSYFSAMFGEYGVPYVNFNREYYDYGSHDINDFTDYDGHMNGEGARVFSKSLGRILNSL